jgi:hypothetical protein
MPREKHAPHRNLRALGLIREAENFAAALRLISLGMIDMIPPEHGGAITTNAVEISKRLESLKALLQNK